MGGSVVGGAPPRSEEDLPPFQAAAALTTSVPRLPVFAAELAFPERVAHHRAGKAAAATIVGGSKQAAGYRFDAEGREEVAGDPEVALHAHFAFRRQIEGAVRPREESRKPLLPLADHALAFDRVKPADHEQLNDVPSDVKEKLKAKSAERIKKSEDFAKLQKQIEQFKARKARKAVTLNEQELRDQVKKTEKGDKNDLDELKDDDPTAPEVPEKSDKGEYKLKRTFVNNEILQIMEDYLRERK